MKSDRRIFTLTGLGLAAALFVLVNAVSNMTLRGVSLDFTEDGLFTISDGTRQVLGEIDEPITLKFFFSEGLGKEAPAYAQFGARVRELLQRYADLSGGNLRLEIYNPTPFSEVEDMAVGYGLQGVPVNQSGDLVYFGLAGANSTDDEQVIAFFQPDRERFLEYDLTRMVSDLAHPKKKVIGVLTSLPLNGMPGNPMAGPTPGGGSPPWMILEQMRQTLEVRMLGTQLTAVDQDIEVLMVVHPKSLSDATRYALDQFVLGGGKALIFVDPHSESDPAGRPMGGQLMGGASASSQSSLPGLLAAWGVQVDGDKIVGDLTGALRINAGNGARVELVNYIAWINLDRDRLNREDVVTADLSRLTFATTGHITATDGATTTLTPLVSSSPDAMLIEAGKLRFFPNFKGLLSDFVSEDRVFVLAARISGSVKSAFPDGRPKAEHKDEGKDDGKDEAEEENAEEGPPHLAESVTPINLIVVADSDMLEDRFWVQVQDFFGQRLAMPVSGNADFVVNALDNLSGSNALIGLRSRGQTARPFQLVEKLQADAEQRFRDKEKVLQEKLEDTERRLSELQTQDGGAGRIILSPEQARAIEDFRSQMVSIRKELRGVQLALRQDIDRLGQWLKFINIGLIPLLIAFAALGLGLWRRKRRAAAHAAGAVTK